MKCQKLGRLYVPDGRKPWSVSHAANPTPVSLGGDLYRIYFATRDAGNRSHTGWIEVDLKDPFRILAEASEPALGPGELGMFDDSGVSIGCVVPVEDKRFLYYMGWNLAVTVPWKNAIGLAVANGSESTFLRHSRFPVLDLCEADPYTMTYPWVLRDGATYRMWYGSSTRWLENRKEMRHVLKYAESVDGIHWIRDGSVVVDIENPGEMALVKPCVIRDPDRYRMWFSALKDGPVEAYRILYAESRDGVSWERKDDETWIDVSESGWDSEMVAYGTVFDHGGSRYMLYAGNGCGREGFGLAILDESRTPESAS
ncbi:MAG: hypothetical protein KDM91_09255 [Verrucomicrobiae bacterium]|nr:hypothetical protein [Verrucomicrobiae bacterium]MCP5540637.1 hypothetical protein [Akkermansiaceae bacterium]